MRTLAQRFAAKYVELPSGCWEWVGTRNEKGYGMFWSPSLQRPIRAHRFAWEQAYGRAIPEGLTIDHLCRFTSCVNPDHLEPVTDAENQRRGWEYRRQRRRAAAA